MRESVKLKNKSFTVYIELRNIRRSITKNDKGEYRYMFDIYIEGKLETKDATIRARSTPWIIYKIKHEGLKTKIFL